MSYQAYQKVQRDSDNPSETEYRVFVQVTRALQDARELKRFDPAFIKALDWNRRLWSTLATDCGLPGNKLPNETRAGIISLAMWVSRHSTQVARGKADLDPLISVNRSIMTGLNNQSRQTPPKAGPVQDVSADQTF